MGLVALRVATSCGARPVVYSAHVSRTRGCRSESAPAVLYPSKEEFLEQKEKERRRSRTSTLGTGKLHTLKICRLLNGVSGDDQALQTVIQGVKPALVEEALVDYSSVLDPYIGANRWTFSIDGDDYELAELLYGCFRRRVLQQAGEEVGSRLQVSTTWRPPAFTRMTGSVVKEAVALSRKRLSVSKVDALFLDWRDTGSRGFLDALLFLAELREQGKIGVTSVTNFNSPQLQLAFEKETGIVANKVHYSMIDRRAGEDLRELCSYIGVQMIANGALFGGFFTDRYLDVWEPGTSRGDPLDDPVLIKYKKLLDSWGSWDVFQQLLRECKIIAKKHGVALPAVAARWVLDQPLVAAVELGGGELGVPVSWTRARNEAMERAFGLCLDEEDMERIATILARGRDLGGSSWPAI
eukprot:jgi/Mesvir1/6989/Mv09128-RA.1